MISKRQGRRSKQQAGNLAEASALIEEARGSEERYLTPSRLDLTELPESIGQLSQLKKLSLTNNRLATLPESLRNLTQLEELYLQGNNALGLPAEVLESARHDRFAAQGKPVEVLDYYFRVRGGPRRPLNEAKLILVGRGVRLFISYSHRDESSRKELETHLKILQQRGLIDIWSDRDIEAGDDWRQKIDDNLERADIILLLVSADFNASDYCREKEMKRALERERGGEAVVIPVIVRDANLDEAPFSYLQYLPEGGKAVALWGEHKDSAWRSVSEGIEKVTKQIRTKFGQAF